MIIVPVKEGENIERALKKFKRKFEKTGAPHSQDEGCIRTASPPSGRAVRITAAIHDEARP